jgi:hypothetical protein
MTNINSLLSGFNGTETFFMYRLTDYVYTDGVQHLAKIYGAYWLIDAIISHQLNPDVAAQPHQTWILKRISGLEFRLYCEDGNHNFVTEQIIPFSDFTGDEVTLWLVDETLMLPSEY